MQNKINLDDSERRKTQSHRTQEQQELNRMEANSPNIVEATPHSDIDSGKAKEGRPHQARKSNWSSKEKIKYMVFIHYYSELPNWGSDLKSIRTFKLLSKFIKTRSPEQCKSFHLSTRRNYKSFEQMLKSLQMQLQDEKGYKRLLERYELEIMEFQVKNKELQLHQLEEKNYFANKVIDKSKKCLVGYENSQNKPNSDEKCSFKINITELIREKQSEEKRNTPELVENLVQSQSKTSQQEQQQVQKQPIKPSQNRQTQQFHNIFAPSPFPMNFFMQNQLNQPNAVKNPNEKSPGFDPTKQINAQTRRFFQKTYGNLPNTERMVQQQNYNRMMQGNKNMFTPYQSYNAYQNNPFGGFGPINQMQMAQYRNQMQFSIPPPGGIAYMIQGYSDPYMGMQQSGRYPLISSIPQQAKKTSKQKQKGQQQDQQNRQQKMINPQQKQPKYISQNRKQLVLQCHQHWLNWLRAAMELNRRKQAQQLSVRYQ